MSMRSARIAPHSSVGAPSTVRYGTVVALLIVSCRCQQGHPGMTMATFTILAPASLSCSFAPH
jgi:hypothetical protein